MFRDVPLLVVGPPAVGVRNGLLNGVVAGVASIRPGSFLGGFGGPRVHLGSINL